jgi:pimeloyl-ACP methyl ester carboxylesterase
VRARVRDVELEYEVLGDGPELVWLHGLSGSLEESRPLCERLARDYRVLWFSSRGHGRSTPLFDKRRFAYEEFADDLQAMVEHAGFDQPVIAGGSHGSNTLLRHAVRHPGVASALLAVAPGANSLRRPPRLKWALVKGHVTLAALRGEHAVVQAITGHDPRDTSLDDVALQAVAAARSHDPKALVSAMRLVPDQQAVPPAALSAITVPTTVAAWDKDPLIHPIAVAREIARLIPGATFVEMPKATELTHDEAAALVSGWVADLLRPLP